MADVVISSGVHSSGLYVSHGETLAIDSGASVFDTSVRGDEVISAGGSAGGDVIDNGIFSGTVGLQDVYGSATDAILHSGGEQRIWSGGVAFDTHVRLGGIVDVKDDGVASDVQVGAAGSLLVGAGGSAVGGNVDDGASVLVEDGGVASGLRDEGHMVVGGGAAHGAASAIGTLVLGGGTGVVAVESGGFLSDTHLFNTAIYLYDGVAKLTYLRGTDAYTELYVNGGVASDTRVLDSATEVVTSGSSIRDVIFSGGSAALFGGDADYLSVKSGGDVFIASAAAKVTNLTLSVGAELIVPWFSATAKLSDGVLTFKNASGQLIGSATLIDGGAGVGLGAATSSPYGTEFTVTAVTSDARPAVLAQSLAGFGDSGTLAGSTASHAGMTSALSEVMKPR